MRKVASLQDDSAVFYRLREPGAPEKSGSAGAQCDIAHAPFTRIPVVIKYKVV